MTGRNLSEAWRKKGGKRAKEETPKTPRSRKTLDKMLLRVLGLKVFRLCE